MTQYEREQIIKALECCGQDDIDCCRECPIKERCRKEANVPERMALSLINELIEENEKLRESQCDSCSCTVRDERGAALSRVIELEERVAFLKRIIGKPSSATELELKRAREYAVEQMGDLIKEYCYEKGGYTSAVEVAIYKATKKILGGTDDE